MRIANCKLQIETPWRRRPHANWQFSIFNFQFAICVVGLLALCAAGCKPSAPDAVFPLDTKSGDRKTAQHNRVKVLTPQPDYGALTWKGKHVGAFSLTERSGKTITNSDLLGKPNIVCFIFTHCAGPCTDVTRSMTEMQSWLKAAKIDARLVTFTVDPKRDTPARLARYAEAFGAGKDWWFLTGDEDRIYPLIRDTFGQEVHQQTGADRKPGWEVFHTTAVMLVDPKGRIVEEFNAKNDLSMVQLQQRLTRWKRTGSFDDAPTSEPSAAPPPPLPEPKP